MASPPTNHRGPGTPHPGRAGGSGGESPAGGRRSSVGVIDKSVAVLDAVAAAPRSLSELAEATGLPRATAHRLASALVVHGLLRVDRRGAFALGYRCTAYAGAVAADVVEAAPDLLRGLRDEVGESAQLYVSDGAERWCLAEIPAAHELRTTVGVGSRLPLDKGSAGRVLSGECPPSGWVHTVAERAVGVASVSAPVRDGAGRVVAAVSVSGPADRLGKSRVAEVAEAVRGCADLLSRRLAGEVSGT